MSHQGTYSFVKQCGDHIKIYSELGHGTTVKICLPRHSGSAIEAISVKSASSTEGIWGEVILAVEDDSDVLQNRVEALRDLGYQVFEAGDGPFALELLKTQTKIDVLFTDVVLPGGIDRRGGGSTDDGNSSWN